MCLISRGMLLACAVCLLTIFMFGGMANDANAAIKCSGPYQVIKGQGKIATPYCEDNYLASVARSYGMNISARAVRQNPHKKQEACRIAGHDIRVANICAGHRDESGGRR